MDQFCFQIVPQTIEGHAGHVRAKLLRWGGAALYGNELY